MIVVVSFVVLMLVAVNQFPSSAQPTSSLQSGFGQAITAVNQAEAAGATQSEISPLVDLLNNALELNQEASNLPTNQTDQRNALLSSASQILTNITNQANYLTTTSTQRTHTNKITTYVTGLVLAVVGTSASFQKTRALRHVCPINDGCDELRELFRTIRAVCVHGYNYVASMVALECLA